MTTLLEHLEPRQLLSSVTWDGGGDGVTLTQPANWAGDVLPTSADDAIIAAGPAKTFTSGTFSAHSLTSAAPLDIGGGTITLAAASSLASLTMSGGTITGAADLAISATFNWTGGSVAGSGTLTLGPSCSSTFAGFTKGANRNIVNNGSITWTDGNIGGYAGPAITLTNNGSFAAAMATAASLAANSAPNTFVNNGSITKSGSATASFDGFTLTSAGPIAVTTGTLKIAGGGSQSALTTIASGATLDHGLGAFSYTSAATFAGTGSWTFSNGNTSFDAAFNPAGSVSIPYGTLTLNAASQSFSTLAISGGALAGPGNLTVSSTFNWTGGRVDGGGLLTIAPTAAANFTSGALGVNRNITNNGAITWLHATLGGAAGPGVTFTNNGTMTAALDADTLFWGNTSPNTLINHGTFTKSGPFTLSFSQAALTNTGTLAVTGGDLILSSGGGLGGTVSIAAGAFLDLTGGSFTDTATTITGAGNLRLQGGTHTLTAAITTSALTELGNATIGGPGNLNLNAATSWTNGTMSGTGTTTVGPGITLSITSYATKNLGRTLVNNGRIEHDLGYLQWTGDATLTNPAGHTYNLTGSGRLYAMGTNNQFTNAGTFNDQSDQDVVIMSRFDNAGVLNLFNGVLGIEGGGTNTGVRNIASGSTLSYRASYTHAAGSTAAGSGYLLFNGGTQTISGNWSASCFLQLLQGTLTGAGNLTTNGPFSWAAGNMTGPGNITIGPSGKLALVTYYDHVLGRSIVNNGQLHFLNGVWHLTGVTITNNGTFALLPGNAIVASSGVNSVANAGLLRKMSSSNLTFDAAISLNNTGTIDVRNGTLNLSGPMAQIAANTLTAGTWQVYPTGALNLGASSIHTLAAGATVNLVGGYASFPAITSLATNNGTLNLTLGGILHLTPSGGVFTNNGAINVGADRGLSITGSFTQSATGHLNLSVANDTRFSHVQSTGPATLGGAVAFTFLNSYTPAIGRTFNFLAASSRTGQFATATIPTFPGRTPALTYLPAGARLTVS